MSLHRIFAITLRYLYLFKHSFDRLSDAFYWPTIDLAVWGLTGAYLQHLQKNNTTPIVIIIVSGIVFWYILWRAQYEMTVNLLEDLWDRNLINTFVAPLKFSEWITSFIVLGIIKAIMSLLFTTFVAYILYKVQIFSFGLYIIPFFALLMMTGWAVGLFVTGLILRYGTRIQTLAWAMVAIISPFSAVYYPVSSLPVWAQKISAFIPSTYVFEGIRQVIGGHGVDPEKLLISLLLNIFYLSVALLFVKKSFQKLLEKGFIE